MKQLLHREETNHFSVRKVNSYRFTRIFGEDVVTEKRLLLPRKSPCVHDFCTKQQAKRKRESRLGEQNKETCEAARLKEFFRRWDQCVWICILQDIFLDNSLQMTPYWCNKQIQRGAKRNRWRIKDHRYSRSGQETQNELYRIHRCFGKKIEG